MLRAGTMQTTVMPYHRPLLTRFAAKLLIDVLPAAAASLVGGFLITQYQFHQATAPRPAIAQAAPASAEMVQLVRDEHAMIMDYLKVQMTAEQSRYDAEDAADARAVADAKAAAAVAVETPSAPRRMTATATIAAKPVTARNKSIAAATVPAHAPLVIAQAEAPASAPPAASTSAESKSLLDRTLDIKDHVVHATLHAVSAIGSIPSWIASMGDRIGGNAASNADARQLTTSS
jgi:hypothetical protein